MSHRPVPAPPPGTPPSRPLRADAERNRRRIIAAAHEVFARRGLEVTLDDIARHAGVGVGTAYRRFANRDELIEAVFEDAVQRLVALAEDAASREDPWDGVVHLILSAAEEFAADRGLREVLLEGARGPARAVVMRERLAPLIDAVITRAQRAGRLREDMVATDFPLIHLMLGAVTEHSRAVAPGLWKRYVTFVLDGLRHDRDRPTPLPHPALGQDDFDRSMT